MEKLLLKQSQASVLIRLFPFIASSIEAFAEVFVVVEARRPLAQSILSVPLYFIRHVTLFFGFRLLRYSTRFRFVIVSS